MHSDNLQILVVEDNPGDLLLIRHLIHNAGINDLSLFAAETLTQAESHLKTIRTDLIFLDLFLPDSAGLETFSQINKQAHAIPVIVLSGFSDLDTAIKSIQSGAQDYLIKGEFDEKVLAKSILYSIERKKIQERLNQSLEMHELVGRATTDAIWDWDLKNKTIIQLSQGMETFFGYENMHTHRSFAWWLAKIHSDDLAGIKDSIRSAFLSDSTNASFEFRFCDGGGNFREVLARTLILRKTGEPVGQPYRVIGAMQDITNLKRLKNKILRNRIVTQRLITEATINSQEKEREELGKELHDNINQILTTSKMFIDIAMKNPALRDELLPKSLSNLSNAIEELRKLSKSLVPPTLEDLGLEDAIRDLLLTASMVTSVEYTFKCEDVTHFLVPQNIQLMAFRIVQEQVNNISKYAKASQGRVHLWFEKGNMCLSVADNGIGFDPHSKVSGIGLRNIKSRVRVHHGRMTIVSSPGHGCTLKISIPVRTEAV